MKTKKCDTCKGLAIMSDGSICRDCLGFGIVPDKEIKEETNTIPDPDYPHPLLPLPKLNDIVTGEELGFDITRALTHHNKKQKR